MRVHWVEDPIASAMELIAAFDLPAVPRVGDLFALGDSSPFTVKTVQWRMMPQAKVAELGPWRIEVDLGLVSPALISLDALRTSFGFGAWEKREAEMEATHEPPGKMQLRGPKKSPPHPA